MDKLSEITVNGVKLRLKQGDITLEEGDAIVNAANSGLMGGGGVDGAIHRAGGPAILEENKKIVARQGPLPAGKAVMTTGGNLPAKHVIHTVGPVWQGGNRNEANTLASAYRESLKLAVASNFTRVSFPSISTGAYGYPVAKAASVALEAVAGFLKAAPGSLKEVTFVLFDVQTLDAYRQALADISDNE